MRSSRSRVPFVAGLALLLAAVLAPAAYAGDIDAVSFKDASFGVMGGGFTSFDGMQRTGFTAVTTDGGSTWATTRVAQSRIRAVSAKGASLAVSDYPPLVLAYSGATGLWPHFGVAPAGDTASLYGVTTLSSGRTVAVGVRTDSRGDLGLIVETHNGGASWNLPFQGPLYPAPDVYVDPPQTHAALAGIDEAPDGSVAWVVGNEWSPSSGADGSTGAYKNRLLLRSTDGGSTWVTQTVPVQSGKQPVTCITVPSSSEAFIFGSARQYLKTVNGGASWVATTLTSAGSTVAPEVNLAAADSRGQRIVAVGKYGLTVHSLDGGAIWHYVRVPGTGTLRGVAMLSDTKWLAVGANETMLWTTDSGKTWTGQKSAVAPTAAVTGPSAGSAFFDTMPVLVSGTAADTGVGVVSVAVRVRRADGRSWTGANWVPGDTWLPAQTKDGWNTWSVSWQPDAELVSSGQLVTLTARSTDGLGLTGDSAGVPLGTSPSGAIVLAGGAVYTNAATVPVPVAVSATGATSMRSRVGTDSFPPDWKALSAETTVTLTSPDGTKTVEFQFSSDGVNVSASASDTIVLDTKAPTAAFASPSPYFSAATNSLMLSATANDALSGVRSMKMSIQRGGLYWDRLAAAWVSEQRWVAESVTGPCSFFWRIDVPTATGSLPVTISVVSEDAAGNRSTAITIARPKTKPYLTAPSSLPLSMVRGRYYSAIGYLKPQHASGRYAVKLQAYRYERQPNGTYKWVLRRVFNANGASAQRYYGRIALPYAGRWSVRAYHFEDATHLASVGPMRQVRVR